MATPAQKRGISRNTRIAAIVIAVIIIVAVVAVVYVYYIQKPAPKTLLVGVVGPFTGGLGSAGTPWLDGIKAWANITNAAGGVTIGGTTYTISLKLYDDASNPSTAATDVRTAVSVDHVQMLATCFLTPDTDAVAPIVQQLQMPVVCGATDDPEFHTGNQYLYSIYPNSTVQFTAYADFMKSLSPSITTISILSSNEEAMEAMVHTETRLLGSGFTYVYNQTYDGSSLTSSVADSYLLAANAAHPQMIWLADEYPGNEAILYEEMAHLGIRPPMIWAFDMWDDPYLINTLGATMNNGPVGQNYWASNMSNPSTIVDPYVGSIAYTDTVEYYNAVLKAYGQTIALSELPYQGAMQVAVEMAAYVKAGTLNGPAVAAVLPTVTAATPGGYWKYSADGLNSVNNNFVVQIQNGQVVIIWPAQLATGTLVYPLSSTWP